MCRLGNVGYGALIQGVDLYHEFPAVETLIKQRSRSVSTDNPGRKSRIISRRIILGDLDFIDNSINDLRLHQIDLAIYFLLDVDAKVILNVFLVLDV